MFKEEKRISLMGLIRLIRIGSSESSSGSTTNYITLRSLLRMYDISLKKKFRDNEPATYVLKCPKMSSDLLKNWSRIYDVAQSINIPENHIFLEFPCVRTGI